MRPRLILLLRMAFVATTVACSDDRPGVEPSPSPDASAGRDTSRDPDPTSDLDASPPLDPTSDLDASPPLDASLDIDASTLADAAPDIDASSPPEPAPLVEETFAGSIERFYSDTIYHGFFSNAGECNVRVTSIIEPQGAINQTSIGIAAYPAELVDGGYACDLSRIIVPLFNEFQLDDGSSLTAQLEAGWYCLAVFDGGQLSDGVTEYTIVVSHP